MHERAHGFAHPSLLHLRAVLPSCPVLAAAWTAQVTHPVRGAQAVVCVLVELAARVFGTTLKSTPAGATHKIRLRTPRTTTLPSRPLLPHAVHCRLCSLVVLVVADEAVPVLVG